MKQEDVHEPIIWHSTADRFDSNEVKQDYITLNGLAERLCSKVELLLKPERAIPQLGFSYYHLMVGLFLLNQLHYLEDILKVIPGRSAEVISRTMVEGYLKLLWVEQQPSDRAQRWFDFSWVQEWKTFIRESTRGKNVDDDKSRLFEELTNRATIHFNDEGIQALARGEDITPFGHFKSDSTGKSSFELAKKTGLRLLYSKLYDPYNDWVHWSPKGFLKSSDTPETGVVYTFRSYYQSVTCLIAGIVSVLGCKKIWARAYEFDVAPIVGEIENEFRPWSPLND